MNTLENTLSLFQTISLNQMDEVKLMDRIDTKYVFSIEKLEPLLWEIKEDYKILEVAGKVQSDYETLYFDTSDFRFFHDHQHGKGTRYKVRFRVYLSNKLSFLEVKLKNNKGRTVKERVKVKSDDLLESTKSRELLSHHPLIKNLAIHPTIWVNYTRITLVHHQNPIRMTIDTNLHFIRDDKRIDMGEIAILELKRQKSSVSPVEKLLKAFRISPMNFSKYIQGIMKMYPSIKINNFKERTRVLNKISQ